MKPRRVTVWLTPELSRLLAKYTREGETVSRTVARVFAEYARLRKLEKQKLEADE